MEKCEKKNPPLLVFSRNDLRSARAGRALALQNRPELTASSVAGTETPDCILAAARLVRSGNIVGQWFARPTLLCSRAHKTCLGKLLSCALSLAIARHLWPRRRTIIVSTAQLPSLWSLNDFFYLVFESA